MTGKVKSFFVSFNSRHTGQECVRARTLLLIQLALLLLQLLMMLVVFVVNSSERRSLYLLLLSGLLIPLLLSLVLNIRGLYKPAACVLVLTTLVGPWLSVLLDKGIASGDFMPLVYIAMSIQFSAVVLSGRWTLMITFVQLSGLSTLILTNTALQLINWASLLAYVVFTGALSIVASRLSKQQLEQSERDRQLLMESEARLQQLAVRDSLTGLFNRRYMEETLGREISRAHRERRGLGIIMTDVDNFKQINDEYGHALGDAVLAGVGELLGKHIRKSDVACRFGGDEFILILPECSLEDTVLRAEALRHVVEAASFRIDGADIGTVTLSVGVSSLPEHAMDAAGMLRAADKALYAAKHKGRNRVEAAGMPVDGATFDGYREMPL